MLALDETGQEKKGECTAGVKRQHMGCADGVANGINTVHASLVREDTGHALVGFRQWIPEEHVTDPVRSLRAGLPLDLRFRTKGELAIEICQEVAANGVTPDFTCGDEVYGACTKLREHLEQEEQAYVLRVPKNFRFTMHWRHRPDLRRSSNETAEVPAPLGSPLRRHGIEGQPLVRLGLDRHRLRHALGARAPPPEDR